MELPEGDWVTVAGLCLALARQIPAVGDVLATEDGVKLEVIDASPRRVRSVRLHLPAHATGRQGSSA